MEIEHTTFLAPTGGIFVVDLKYYRYPNPVNALYLPPSADVTDAYPVQIQGHILELFYNVAFPAPTLDINTTIWSLEMVDGEVYRDCTEDIMLYLLRHNIKEMGR